MGEAPAAVSARWLAAALPALALGDDPDEADLTAICECALLVRLGRRALPSAMLAPLFGILPDWVLTQSEHPAWTTLISRGPPLALTGPLTLHAALDTVSPFDSAELRARATAAQVSHLSPIHWRQRELARLLAAAGADWIEPLSPRFLPADPSQATETDAYCFTHEVFHETDFGSEPGEADWRRAACDFLDATIDAVIAADHADLIAEYAAAAACLDHPVTPARAEAMRMCLTRFAPNAPVLASYHPYLASVIAALCGSPVVLHP